MPYYHWKGIDIHGASRKGAMHAHSINALEQALHAQGVALLNVRHSSLMSKVTAMFTSYTLEQELIIFFDYLYHLLESGISLINALKVSTSHVVNKQFKEVLYDIIQDVEHGVALSMACARRPLIFSSLIIESLHAGEKTGALTVTLKRLCLYLNNTNEFKKKLLQASFFPLLTLLCAFLITIAIIVFLIPQFQIFFTSMGQEIPSSTQKIFDVSNFLRSSKALIIPVVLMMMWLISKTVIVRSYIYRMVMYIPVLGPTMNMVYMLQTLHMIALFLHTGVPLKQALELIIDATKSPFYKKQLSCVLSKILHGELLSEQYHYLLNTQHAELLKTFTQLGEQTGALGPMLSKATTLLEESLYKNMHTATLLFQPILLIIIGLIIAFLMVAIYMPLFTMAYVTL